MKELLKRLVKALPIAFTKNQQYDQQTLAVIRKVCGPTSNTLDIGCHKGEVLDLLLAAAPNGSHYGFEAIPAMADALRIKYSRDIAVGRVVIKDVALSDTAGTATFNHVISNPAYSGLQRRSYDRPDEVDEQITVKTARLDDLLPATCRVDLIKLDVEGAELLVLEGARETLRRTRPIVVFEHGLGATDAYGATPEAVFDLLAACGLHVTLMRRWLRGEADLSRAAFVEEFQQRTNYYFLAHP